MPAGSSSGPAAGASPEGRPAIVNWKVAAALLVIFAAVAVFTVQSRPKPGYPHPAPALIPCGPTEAVGLRISGPAGETFEAQRASPRDDWSVTKPQPGPADSRAVDALAGAIDLLRPIESLKSIAPGQDLGLEPAATTISCSLRGGASYTLSVGGQSFDGSGNYARVNGDAKVHIIPVAEVGKFQKALVQPPYRPSPTPLGSPSPSPST